MFERYKIKKLLKPRQGFTEQTKTAFMAVFDVAHPAARRSSRGFTATAKSLIAGGAFVAVLTGVSVYADTANVAADSPLYPLKRLGESVQLAVAPAAEKAQLQATFAGRRADEITDLETRKPSSTQITSLSNDLNTALNSSLNDAQSAKLGDGKLTNFCDKIFSAIATSSVEVQGNNSRRDGMFGSKGNIVDRFLNQCGQAIDVDASSTTGTRSRARIDFHFPER